MSFPQDLSCIYASSFCPFYAVVCVMVYSVYSMYDTPVVGRQNKSCSVLYFGFFFCTLLTLATGKIFSALLVA